MVELVACYKGEEAKYAKSKTRLEKTIQKMSFSQVHRLLAPCFEAFKSVELAEYLPAIDTLRNEMVHRISKSALYEGRSPFNDAECFAELYVHSWVVDKELWKFVEKRIDDPNEIKKLGWLHYTGKLK